MTVKTRKLKKRGMGHRIIKCTLEWKSRNIIGKKEVETIWVRA
jgi:hypothetical protein